jgi:hypothetical protein
MMKQFCILLIFSLTSCSVKKQIAKTESQESIKTEIKNTQTEQVNTYAVDNVTTYEIVVEAQDSLKPITINLNGTTRVFSNAKRVSLVNQIKSLKTSVNALKTQDSIVSQDSVIKKEDIQKDIEKKSNFDFIIIIIVIIIILSIRKYIKLYI